MKTHNYKIISIPVNFIVTSTKTFIINNKSLTTELSDSEWTFGLRGLIVSDQQVKNGINK